MRKAVAAAAISASLLGGTVLGATMFVPQLVGAQDSTQADPAAPPAAKGAWMAEALKPLVDNGTINQAQADAVTKALQDARPAHGHGPGRGLGGPASEAVASALGIDAATLRSELQAGKTLAQIAGDKGVDAQAVIDAIVGEMSAKIDEKVTAGRITAEQAATMKENLAQRAADVVNGVHVGPGRHGHGGRGPGSTPSVPSAFRGGRGPTGLTA